MALETETDIHVDATGQWWNGSELLIHEGILFFFKNNLYRAADGRYFIRNEFGDKTETGWLKTVAGFPLFADRAFVEPEFGLIRLVIDTGLIIERRPSQIFAGGEDMLWTELMPSEQHPSCGDCSIPLRLRPAAMSALGPYLEEDDGHWLLRFQNGDPLLIESKQPEFS